VFFYFTNYFGNKIRPTHYYYYY